MKKHDSNQPNPGTEIIEDNLHDLLNWLHSGIILPLEEMDEWLKQGDYDKLHEVLPPLILRAKSVLNEVKDMKTNIFEGKPSTRHDLSVSLQELAAIWLSRVGLQDKRSIIIHCPAQTHLSGPTCEALLSIADEGIANALKHSGFMAQAKTWIRIKVEPNDTTITLEVEDNGHGAGKYMEGYGLKKIRRIVSELEHTGLETNLETITSPGSGFTLRVAIQAFSKRK